MGLLRPRILLPTRVVAEFQPSELRLIFLHELAHLRRGDVAVNWLITRLEHAALVQSAAVAGVCAICGPSASWRAMSWCCA